MNLRYEGIYGYVDHLPKEKMAFNALRDHFSIDDPDRWIHESFRKGYWDGKRRVITEKGRFLRGLTTNILKWGKDNGIDVSCSVMPNQAQSSITKGLRSLSDSETLKGIELADHQRRMVSALLDYGGGTAEGVTGSGKTECITLLMKILSTKINIIFVLVHRIGLMEQSFQRFKVRCPELSVFSGMLGDGKKPKEGSRFVFSTQQSLSSALALKRKGKAPNEEIANLWANAGAVIIDECHNVTQDDYITLLETMPDQAGVYQFSGTPETNDQIRDWTITGIGGPIVCRVKRPELEDKGFIAKAVACLRVFQ